MDVTVFTASSVRQTGEEEEVTEEEDIRPEAEGDASSRSQPTMRNFKREETLKACACFNLTRLINV